MRHRSADLAVVIGRFQPFHLGHADLLARALATAPRVLVVLGSALRARSPKDPFTWRERAGMIAATLAPGERERVTCVPVRDYYDDARWTDAIRALVMAHTADGDRVALVGHEKDASSYYLRRFPTWDFTPCERARDVDATAVRRVLFEADGDAAALQPLQDRVPQPVLDILGAWLREPPYAPMVQEYRALAAYHAAWRAAPYPPVFVTVDAVVVCAGHVLLVERGGFPGKGLCALPGGFLDQHERLLDATIRELHEETGFASETLAAACTGVAVFDHPERSLRGRTITHAHRFDLGGETLPAVTGADDATQARWVPLAELADMEEGFHEDHFQILDTMLGLTAARPA